MKPIIITLSGVAHSGKDTTADYLVKELNKLGINTIKLGLADQLKVISHKLIQLFYGINIPFVDFYDLEKKELIRPELPYFDAKPFKLRTILQKVGTEVIRDSLWDGIWCDYINRNLKDKFKDYQVIIISDCRFPDELDYFLDLERKGQISRLLSIRINRSNENGLDEENKAHASESHIATMKVNYEIANVGTLEHLYNSLDKLIVPLIINHTIDDRESKKLKTNFKDFYSPILFV